MNDYWMETGACLVLFQMLASLIGIITWGVIGGMWPLAFFYPPLLFLVGCAVNLWLERPSIDG